MRINRPIRLVLIAAGLAGGWWVASLRGEHDHPADRPNGHRPAATRPATQPVTVDFTYEPVK